MRLGVIEMKKGVRGKRTAWMADSVKRTGRGNVLGWFVITFPPFSSSFSSQQWFSFNLVDHSQRLERCRSSAELFWAPNKDAVVVQARTRAWQAPELSWKIPGRRGVQGGFNLFRVSGPRSYLFYGSNSSKAFPLSFMGRICKWPDIFWSISFFRQNRNRFISR